MSDWTPAYNTNGFAHHRLEDAVRVLAELGYGGVALTLDVHHLDPFSPGISASTRDLRRLLDDHGLRVVIESGARFNLDVRRKHFPSLLCLAEASSRIDFLERCLEVASELRADCVSMWSGHDFDDLGVERGFEVLGDAIEGLLARAEELDVPLAFEPEPGMFVEDLGGYRRLKRRFPGPHFGLALDLGHLMVTRECEIPDAILEHRDDIITVAIEDMKRGVHEHLPFGEGDIDFDPVFGALEEIGYDRLLSVELSRHSSVAPIAAAEAMAFLGRYRD